MNLLALTMIAFAVQMLLGGCDRSRSTGAEKSSSDPLAHHDQSVGGATLAALDDWEATTTSDAKGTTLRAHPRRRHPPKRLRGRRQRPPAPRQALDATMTIGDEVLPASIPYDAAMSTEPGEGVASPPGFARAVLLVAILNLAYFGVEFAVATAIGSVSLLADSVDFLEDASINTLILLGLRWGAARRAKLGMALAGILLAPGLATLWMAWRKFVSPAPPSPIPLSAAGLGALAVNLACALMLARYRRHSGSLTRAAFLSARNDVLANIAIVVAGLVTAFTTSAWPDLIVGAGIMVLNAGAAKEVYSAARREHREAKP